MAAGSVMNDPASGTRDSVTKYMASSLRKGSTRASSLTTLLTSSRMGRLAATTIITNTKAGSVKFRVSM